ncbi:hypothetical protein ACLBSL_33495, partial [Klebsiella pneumoniae]|uniref:hypothetical protein n=1 Tax=Klebsiella pneumoniae TaxID=573 RepID=UPI0039693547
IEDDVMKGILYKAEKLSFVDIFKMAKEENVKLELHCLIGTRPVRGLIKSLNFNQIRPDI